MKEANESKTTGFRIFRDGNAWCAVEPHFQNLQESRAGFGDTPEEAYLNCVKELEKSNWWRNQPDFPPQFSEFKVEL